ncbi:MAG: hypothetical protein ANABAC_1287 [Anaerolineae bacterium]|nr:MAG: hypothetical protein ANABAC_1287 [Anaerolineae bacterium]
MLGGLREILNLANIDYGETATRLDIPKAHKAAEKRRKIVRFFSRLFDSG